MTKKILVVLLLVALTLGVLAGCNKREIDKKTHEEFLEVLPNAKNFSKVDISNKNIPSTVEEAYYDTEGAGFVIKVVTTGYNYGLTIIVGIDNNGVITGAKCTESNETWGYEENLGQQFIGKDIDTYVDVQAGATSLTVNGYRDGIGDALKAYDVLKNNVNTDHDHSGSDNGGNIFDNIFGDSEYERYKDLIPGSRGFEKVNINGMGLPSTVVEVVKEKNGLGYVVKLNTTGYSPDMIILVAVSSDYKVIGATCMSSKETHKVEQSYGNYFVGLNYSEAMKVDLVSGSTMTTRAYRDAVLDAIGTISLLQGGNVDVRDPEEILLDNLRAALPNAFSNEAVKYSDVFTEGYIILADGDIHPASDFGADAIHKAINGAGYVVECNNEFVSVYDYYNSSASDKAIKIAENIQSLLSESDTIEVDISEYKNSTDGDIKKIFRYVASVNIVESNVYTKSILVVETRVFGYSEEPITILVTLDMDGQIVDNLAISHSETYSIGGVQLEDGEYNVNFNGKNEHEVEHVDTEAGATITTDAYKKAILYAFHVHRIICGTSNNYTLGMGASVNFDSCRTGTAQVDATVATVVLDENGKIVACRIDAAQNTAELYDGEFEITKLEKTKAELLYDYKMSAYGTDNNNDGIVKEWFEQAQAFENYVVGMTANEVRNMGTKTVNYGYIISSDDELLDAGCTIQITEFIDAVVKACNDDQAVSFTANDFDLGLAINSYDDGSTSAYYDDGSMRMYSDFAAVVVSDGKIVAALNDGIQPKIGFDYDGYITTITYNGTKRELKDNYGMSIALNYGMDNDGDGRVLEWYQQSAAFSQYVVGMTAKEVKNMSTTNANGSYISTDSDLLYAGCTMGIDGMKQAVYEAASNAR